MRSVPNADWMNNTRKYVASTTLKSPAWNNSTVIEGDLAEAIARLKEEDGKNIMVNGSGALVRTLMRNHQLDELRLFVRLSYRSPSRSTAQTFPGEQK
jgi:dihydrofolate reductase